MATISRFEELEIWQKARFLNKELLSLIKKEIIQRDFRFKDQIKSAAGSV